MTEVYNAQQSMEAVTSKPTDWVAEFATWAHWTNTFFPVAELVVWMSLYFSVVLAVSVFRFIKSLFPTM